MFTLIKDKNSNTHGWKVLTLSGDDSPHTVRLPVGPVLVPLSVWQARRAELIHREYEHGWPLGVWLAAEEDAAVIEHDIDDFTVIAVEFNKRADSNGFANARLLREHYGYRSELRAIGEVPRDKLSYLSRAGFDTVAAYGHRDAKGNVEAPSGWFDFSAAKQAESLSAVAG